jgi:hypothetical protein
MNDEFPKPSGDCITDRKRQRAAEAKRRNASHGSAACVNCKYWLKQSVASGECRRRAPQVVAYTASKTEGSSGEYRECVDSYTRSEWPTTLAEEWCGEYEPPHDKLSDGGPATPDCN